MASEVRSPLCAVLAALFAAACSAGAGSVVAPLPTSSSSAAVASLAPHSSSARVPSPAGSVTATAPTASALASAAATPIADSLPAISAAWAQQPPVRSAPALPPGSLEVLNDVCHAVAKGQTAGCACCPPQLGADCWQEPSGPETEARFIPHKVFTGAFTGAGKRAMLLADAGGCVYNLGSYGAQILAEHNGKRWQLVDQAPGTTLVEAVPWHLDDGSDGLVTLVHAGKLPWFALGWRRFGPGVEHQRLVEWSNSADGWCVLMEPGTLVASATLAGSARGDRDGDGRADLVVRLRVHAGRFDAALERACAQREAAQQVLPIERRRSLSVAARLPARVVELVFYFDGTTFRPDKARLAAFAAIMGNGPGP